MKNLSLFFILPFVGASPLGLFEATLEMKHAEDVVERRQQHSHDDAPKAPTSNPASASQPGAQPILKAIKIEELTPQFASIRPDAKRVKLTYGPYILRAANVSSQ